jgi:OFA family oxalate/formate antiporter-like MFS transporter
LSSILVTRTGSWHAVFYVAAAMNAAAAILAIVLLKPMRERQIKRDSSEPSVSAAGFTAASPS